MDPLAILGLADGITWGIVPENERAGVIYSRLVDAMQLGYFGTPLRRLLISVRRRRSHWTTLPNSDGEIIRCFVSPVRNADMLALQLMRVALTISLEAEKRGGILLHGALAERDGWSVILAGPGSAGKTISSQRLQPPWRALCDDMTLVVRDDDGIYWAHPWPTWSNLMSGGHGGAWDVQHAVLLKGVFLLSKTLKDYIEPMKMIQAVCALVESSEQTSGALLRRVTVDEMRRLRIQRFENICALVKVVPSYHLHLSLKGAFWEEIERVILAKGNNPV